MSVFAKRQLAPEIPLMTRVEVRGYIMEIKKVKITNQYDNIIQQISSRRLNDKWEESEELCDLLDELTDDRTVGEIAEWILRQYFNRPEQGDKKVQPPPYAFARRYVIEMSLNQRKRSGLKSSSLRDQMFRKTMSVRIQNDPNGYAAAREGKFVPVCSLVTSSQEKRPLKRKLVLVMKNAKKRM